MDQFGWTIPVLIDEAGEIIAGHGRVMAAAKRGITEAPVIIARGWTDEQKRAYRIADNQLSLTSRWNDEFLKLEIGELKLANFDLTVLGFEPGHLSSFDLPLQKGELDLSAAWQGMPEFEQTDETAFRQLVVNFRCQEDVDEFQKKIGQQIGPKVPFIWYPKLEVVREVESYVSEK